MKERDTLKRDCKLLKRKNTKLARLFKFLVTIKHPKLKIEVDMIFAIRIDLFCISRINFVSLKKKRQIYFTVD